MKALTKRSRMFSVLITLVAFAISANALPPLATTISSNLNVPYETFGYVFMLQFIFFTVAAFLGGWLAERFKIRPRDFVLIGLLGLTLDFAVGSLLPAMAWFFLWIIPMGFSGGLVETFGSLIITDYDKPGSTKMINLSQAFYCLGAILAPQLVSLMLQLQLNWRIFFLIFGGSILLIDFIFLFIYKPFLECKEYDPRINAPREKPDIPMKTSPLNLFYLFQNKLFFLLTSSMFLYAGIESSFACWIAVYFEKALYLNTGSAALRLGFFWGGLIIGRLAVLVLPEKFTLWPVMLSGTVGLVAGCLALSFQRSAVAATLLILLTGLLIGPVWSAIVSLCRHLFASLQFTSGVIGIGALGASLGPLLSSLIIRYLGLRFFFPFLAFGSLTLLITVLRVKSKTRRIG
ncbi:MAG: MFS transporter [Spirochaetota bacterium]